LFSYALRRILVAIPLLLAVVTLVFLAESLAPGDPASRYLNPNLRPETIEQVRRNLGLDAPLWVQYERWLASFVRGDFQYSFVNSVPVTDRIASALPTTLILAGAALVLSFLLGILLGVVQAVRQHSLLDQVLSGSSLFFYSMPAFWLAFMLVLLFSVHGREAWGLPFGLPVSGIVSTDHDLLPFWGRVLDRVRHLILPVVTLTLVLAAGISRYVRTSMLEVIRQDYIRTARAKGLPEGRVILKHALRNALIPVITLFGMYFPLLLSGTVLVEVVFALPGMGRLLVDSVFSADYPVVLALTYLYGAAVVVGNLLADLLYGLADPRIRTANG
jgi:peptide/nickel transport system permease protein